MYRQRATRVNPTMFLHPVYYKDIDCHENSIVTSVVTHYHNISSDIMLSLHVMSRDDYLEKSRRDEVPSVFLSPAEENGFSFVLRGV